MVSSQLIKNLQKLGLTRWEAQVFVELVKLETADPSTIAERSKVPQSKIYHVIDLLERKNLISSQIVGKKRKLYRVIPVEQAIKILSDPFTRAIATSEVTLKSLYQSHKDQETSGQEIWTIRGNQALTLFINEIIDNAVEEIFVVFSVECLIRHVPAFIAAIARGVDVKVIITTEEKKQLLNHPEFGSLEDVASDVCLVNLDLYSNLAKEFSSSQFRPATIFQNIARQIMPILAVRPDTILVDSQLDRKESLIIIKTSDDLHENLGIHLKAKEFIDFQSNLIRIIWELWSSFGV